MMVQSPIIIQNIIWLCVLIYLQFLSSDEGFINVCSYNVCLLEFLPPTQTLTNLTPHSSTLLSCPYPAHIRACERSRAGSGVLIIPPERRTPQTTQIAQHSTHNALCGMLVWETCKISNRAKVMEFKHCFIELVVLNGLLLNRLLMEIMNIKYSFSVIDFYISLPRG